MKKSTLDRIDANLETIITKLTEEGQIGAKPDSSGRAVGNLNPPAFDALKLAQDTLGLLRSDRRAKKTAGRQPQGPDHECG